MVPNAQNNKKNDKNRRLDKLKNKNTQTNQLKGKIWECAFVSPLAFAEILSVTAGDCADIIINTTFLICFFFALTFGVRAWTCIVRVRSSHRLLLLDATWSNHLILSHAKLQNDDVNIGENIMRRILEMMRPPVIHSKFSQLLRKIKTPKPILTARRLKSEPTSCWCLQSVAQFSKWHIHIQCRPTCDRTNRLYAYTQSA